MAKDEDGVFRELADKIKRSLHAHKVFAKKSTLNTHLRDAKIRLINKKHQIGKLENLCNPTHRHDESHEKRCDEKRSRIRATHRFGSYFPERDGNLVRFYVDGRNYFWAVSAALDRARETIYIADWWLSPELFLRRPPYYNQEWRLDQVLKRRAEAGVQVYVVVYREVRAALTCNSEHTEHALQALCPPGSPGYGNIHVVRHPDHNVLENAADMTLYWAHHEKYLVIDYATAFVGGLDLCFGRWDTPTHALADVHPEGVTNEIWPGQDFNNNRIMDFQNVQDWKQNELSKAEFGRMPWHDVAVGFVGPCVYDVAEHFVLTWNLIKRDKYKRDPRIDWLVLRGREGDDEDLAGVQRPRHPVGKYVLHPLTPPATTTTTTTPAAAAGSTVRAQLVRSAADWSCGTLPEHSIQNAYRDLIRNAEHYVYIENQFFVTATEPTHACGTAAAASAAHAQAPIRNTIGAAIVDAVVRNAKRGKTNFRVIVVLPVVPGFAGDLRHEAAAGTRAVMDFQYKSICRGPHSIFAQVRAQGVDPTRHIFFFNLRSYDRLATTPAIRRMEAESGVTYRDLQRAEAEEIMGPGIHGNIDVEGGRDRHMGRASEQKKGEREKKEGRGGRGGEVTADKATVDRAKEDKANGGKKEEAHDFRTDSRLPDYRERATDTKRKFEAQRDGDAASGHEGGSGGGGDAVKKPGDSPSVARHAMAGTGSLLDESWAGTDSGDGGGGGSDPQSEVNNWIQEELYVHSKVLIVDDRYVVCGSSNLNDRSQLGTRDSELSVVLEDARRVPSRMDGAPFEARHLAVTLRRRLWCEHLGWLPPEDVGGADDDPHAQPPPLPQPPQRASVDNAPEKDAGAVPEADDPDVPLRDPDNPDGTACLEDPLSDDLWTAWTTQATTNTEIFRRLFHADPDDQIKTFADYDRFLPPKNIPPSHIFDKSMPAGEVRKELDKIRGHLVWMPLEFLKDCEMNGTSLQVNPWTESVFT
ncbi:phospholipase [Niveomyces insectorum RCEF 264]|uniref:Phospholipase n=1 Tax=Niveomyces insectorum RCEF 264 TaxID=1081102 RepID=A0A168A5N2_9HYPO|nr:phospholipase [Niveomyces insectorum RCEF 264]